jgi:hypothetical protein
VLAGVEAQEGARGVFAAEGLVDREAHVLVRVAGGVDQRAAEVAGRGDAEAGDAGRQVGAAQVLGDQRAADGQAVVVVVGAVAERHAVQRVAEVGGVEAAHLQGQRLLVDAQGVDRLGHHARQEVQRLLDAGAGRQHVQVRRQQGRDRAGLAAADDDDRSSSLCCPRSRVAAFAAGASAACAWVANMRQAAIATTLADLSNISDIPDIRSARGDSRPRRRLFSSAASIPHVDDSFAAAGDVRRHKSYALRL